MSGREGTYRDLEVLKRPVFLGRPLRGHPAYGFFISLLAAPMALLIPIPRKGAVDAALSSAPLPAVAAAAGGNFKVRSNPVVAGNPVRGKGLARKFSPIRPQE